MRRIEVTVKQKNKQEIQPKGRLAITGLEQGDDEMGMKGRLFRLTTVPIPKSPFPGPKARISIKGGTRLLLLRFYPPVSRSGISTRAFRFDRALS